MGIIVKQEYGAACLKLILDPMKSVIDTNGGVVRELGDRSSVVTLSMPCCRSALYLDVSAKALVYTQIVDSLIVDLRKCVSRGV